MTAVAVAGFCCAGVVGISRLRERSQRFQTLARAFGHRAAIYALIESGTRQTAASFPRPVPPTRAEAFGPGGARKPIETDFLALRRQQTFDAEKYRVHARYYAELSRKYALAARRPWLPVPPDPPPPE